MGELTAMDGGCLTEVELFEAYRGELPPEKEHQALRHVIDCAICRDQWKKLALDAQVAAGIRSALQGDILGADNAPGLREAMRIPDVIEIPGFFVHKEFIEGGQARVFRAVHEASQEEVAIKVFHNSPLNQADNARFFRELKSLARLRHPHVIPIRSEGEILGHTYFVMPWIDGLPLDDFTKQHSMAKREKVILLSKICSALVHAHKRGVMHLDLKPSNVRVDSSGEPVVMDFGMAQLTEDVADYDGIGLGVAGTPLYMAPEQVNDRDNVDTRADVYTLGLLMHEVLSGRRAKGQSPEDTERPSFEVALQDAPSLAQAHPGIDPELAAIVDTATATDRRDRYQTAPELLADIENYLAGNPVWAMRGRPFYFLRKTARQHLAATVGIAAIVLILSAGLYMRYESERFVDNAYALVDERLQEFYTSLPRAPGRKYLYDDLGEAYVELGKVYQELSDIHSKSGENSTAAEYKAKADRYIEESASLLRPGGLPLPHPDGFFQPDGTDPTSRPAKTGQ